MLLCPIWPVMDFVGLYLQAGIKVATGNVKFPWQDQDVDVVLLTILK